MVAILINPNIIIIPMRTIATIVIKAQGKVVATLKYQQTLEETKAIIQDNTTQDFIETKQLNSGDGFDGDSFEVTEFSEKSPIKPMIPVGVTQNNPDTISGDCIHIIDCGNNEVIFSLSNSTPDLALRVSDLLDLILKVCITSMTFILTLHYTDQAIYSYLCRRSFI